MKKILLAIFLHTFSAYAGFPEGEKGYNLKKLKSLSNYSDEIGNDDCIARALGAVLYRFLE